MWQKLDGNVKEHQPFCVYSDHGTIYTKYDYPKDKSHRDSETLIPDCRKKCQWQYIMLITQALTTMWYVTMQVAKKATTNLESNTQNAKRCTHGCVGHHLSSIDKCSLNQALLIRIRLDGMESKSKLAGPRRYSLEKVMIKVLSLWYDAGLSNPIQTTQVKWKLSKIRSRRGFRKRIETIRRMGNPMWPPTICNMKNMGCSRLNSEKLN